uniref:Uncharacterized protein n=1 Tax=Globisporangium ultimum (strain ATCC 200006 / CBS 805.95 / DAOM BR144) TaxID=431595 RepID=K3WJ37_GLOUD
MGEYAGNTTIRESPLLAAINFSTTPQRGTLFLDKSSMIFVGCTSTTKSPIYQDELQRKMVASLTASLAYNITTLDPANIELIMSVVDCTLSSPRYFYLCAWFTTQKTYL